MASSWIGRVFDLYNADWIAPPWANFFCLCMSVKGREVDGQEVENGLRLRSYCSSLLKQILQRIDLSINKGINLEPLSEKMQLKREIADKKSTFRDATK